MRVPGWCEGCRRIVYVRVSGAGMALLARGLATGLCADCERKQEQERKERQ